MSQAMRWKLQDVVYFFLKGVGHGYENNSSEILLHTTNSTIPSSKTAAGFAPTVISLHELSPGWQEV